MSKVKIKRIEEEMRRAISEILLNDARDKVLKTITITGIRVSNDLSYAKVYFTSLEDMDKLKLEQIMDDSSAFIRLQLASKINLRNTPKLKFVYDDSVAYGQNIDKIISEIHEEKNVSNE